MGAYEEMVGGFPTTPPEPLEEVYYALCKLTEQVSPEKLSLSLTTTAAAWVDSGKGYQPGGEMPVQELEELLEDGQQGPPHAHGQKLKQGSRGEYRRAHPYQQFKKVGAGVHSHQGQQLQKPHWPQGHSLEIEGEKDAVADVKEHLRGVGPDTAGQSTLSKELKDQAQ